MTEPVVTPEMIEAALDEWIGEDWRLQSSLNVSHYRAEMNAAILAALKVAPSPWRPIAEHDGRPDRMNFCWKAFGGIPAHVELGRPKGRLWVNTYGNPFSVVPDYFQPLPQPPGDE